MRVPGAALLIVVLAWGCRAQVASPDDLGGEPPVDMADASPEDLAGADLACSTTEAFETCGNGCDDDKNGYTDDDDPACSSQILPAFPVKVPALYRFVLGPTLQALSLDGNHVVPNAMATYARRVSPYLFLAIDVFDGFAAELNLVSLSPSGQGTYQSRYFDFGIRDVCIFNGELILVEKSTSGRLHRMDIDTLGEKAQINLGMGLVPTGCSGNGDRLVVAFHDLVPNPSQFAVFDASFAPVPGSPFDMPPSLLAEGFDRCLDLAWSQHDRAYWGLFAKSLDFVEPLNDSGMNSDALRRFDLDGSVAGSADAGVLHGVGEFIP